MRTSVRAPPVVILFNGVKVSDMMSASGTESEGLD